MSVRLNETSDPETQEFFPEKSKLSEHLNQVASFDRVCSQTVCSEEAKLLIEEFPLDSHQSRLIKFLS